jgi:hypothetical protein
MTTSPDSPGYQRVRLPVTGLQGASLRAGLLAADAEFFTSSYSSLFLSGTFGAFTFVGSNLPNPPVYPEAVPGIRLAISTDVKILFSSRYL